MFTSSHDARPMSLMNSLFVGTSQYMRCGLRKPDAKISGRAPLVLTYGFASLPDDGTLYRPLALIVPVPGRSVVSGVMRSPLPASASRRCGVVLVAFTSPASPSPLERYRLR